jgi:hypothetical protein
MVNTSLFWMISLPFLLDLYIMYMQFIFRKYYDCPRGEKATKKRKKKFLFSLPQGRFTEGRQTAKMEGAP